jgi:hypothetical protein
MSLRRLLTPRNLGVATVVLLAGLVLRVWILRSVLGEMYADEAYSGLQSLGVIRDGRFPIVIDGNVYSAALEAYVFSPVLVHAGGSVAVLKWLFIGMWAAAVAATFGAAASLRDRRAGAFAAMFVWLAPGAMLVLSTRAYMGYSLGLAVVAGTIWATSRVADLPVAGWRSSALAGFLAGLAFYLHPMFAMVAAPVIAVAAVVHRRDWRGWWAPAVGGAVAANVPLIGWNMLNGFPSLEPGYTFAGTYSDRLKGFVTGLLPRAFGLRTPDGEWVFGKPLGLALYALIIAGVVLGCVVLVRASRRPSRWIVPVAVVCVLPLMALLAPLIFVIDGRYAIIVLPLVAISLGAAASRAVEGWSANRAVAALLVTAVVWVAATSLPFLDQQHAFDAADANAWQDRVISRLDELGVDRLAGDYGLVTQIEYRSDRSIRTAIAGNPYVIRFPNSQRIVGKAPAEEVAFLFRPGAALDPVWFYLPVEQYDQEDLGGVILYVPPAAQH